MPLVLELVVVKTPVVGTSSTPPLRVIGPKAICTVGLPLGVTTSDEPKAATAVDRNVSFTAAEGLPLKANVPPLSLMTDESGSIPPTVPPEAVIRL